MTLTHPARPWLLAAALLAGLPFHSAAGHGSGDAPEPDDPPLPNTTCPVMPDQPSDPRFRTAHKGRPVYFCCTDCARRFETEPDLYSGNLPPVKAVSPAAAREPWSDYVLRHLEPALDAPEFAARRPWLPGYMLAVLCLAAVALRRARRPAGSSGRAGWSERLRRPFARPATVALMLVTGVCVQLVVDRWFGPDAQPVPESPAPRPANPPLASTFAWPSALHEVPRGLSNVYYRGNDERSDKMFNNGRYRTATFHVSVCPDGGPALAAGDSVAGRPLAVRCRIVRAPNTAAGFFTKSRMAAVRLTRADTAEPKDHSFPLIDLREDWEWEAVGPIGASTGHGYEGLRGAWVLCVEGYSNPHY